MFNKDDLKVFADSKEELIWFKNLDSRLENVDFEMLSETDNSIINELIRYDRPDIIVMSENTPLLVLEKTNEVPSGHNISQRFARIARSCELNTDTIIMFPFEGRKHGDYESKCYASPRYFEFFDALMDIHNVQVLPVNHPCYYDGELVPSQSGGDEYISKVITRLINKNWVLDKIDTKFIDNMADKSKQKGIENSYTWPYPPNSVRRDKTEELINKYDNDNVSSYIQSRDESVVLTGDLEKVRYSGDPYVGKMYLYDYLECRNGPTPSFRSSNLFLHIPNFSKDKWLSEIPLDTNNKWSVLYSMADGIIFKDSIIYN